MVAPTRKETREALEVMLEVFGYENTLAMLKEVAIERRVQNYMQYEGLTEQEARQWAHASFNAREARKSGEV